MVERSGVKFLKSQVNDPEVRDEAHPALRLGLQAARLLATTTCATFNRDNVTLETTPIAGGRRRRASVTADGDGVRIDVLVLATGFKVFERDALPPYALVGRTDRDLGELWDAEPLAGVPRRLAPGFPNFFTILGPYAYNGSSYFKLIEATSAHIVRVLSEARRRGAQEIEVTRTAHQHFLAEVMKPAVGTRSSGRSRAVRRTATTSILTAMSRSGLRSPPRCAGGTPTSR